jgi:hypothetical protein
MTHRYFAELRAEIAADPTRAERLDLAPREVGRVHDAFQVMAALAAAGRVWEYHGPRIGWVPLTLPPGGRPACAHPRPEGNQP